MSVKTCNREQSDNQQSVDYLDLVDLFEHPNLVFRHRIFILELDVIESYLYKYIY